MIKSFKLCSLFLLVFLFISCSNQQRKLKNNLVFRYNEHANISSLDPAFAKTQANIWAVNQLFNGLVQLDDSLHIEPCIAKSWKILNNGKSYTFYLRNDVYFHKSRLFGKDKTKKVIAQDFVYSFNRLLDPKVASPGKWVLQNVASYKALNDSVLEIHLKKPFPPFLGLLSMKYCSVVPKEVVDFYGDDFREHPIGTGPFYFKLWVENTKLVFRKNNQYFETNKKGKRLPYLEAVAITFLPDKQSEFLQLVQGNIDFVSGLDPSYKDNVLSANGKLNKRYSNILNMKVGPYLNTEYLGFYLDVKTSNPVASELIRKAINYGFDKKKMILYLRNGIGIPAINGVIPKGLPSFSSIKGYSYNPEKAKELVKAYKNKTKKNKIEITISTDSNYLDLSEYIQHQLKNIGISVKLDVNPPSTLRQAKANGRLKIFRASWIADYPDAENYLSLFYSKNFAPNGPNYTHFKDSVFDNWYLKSFTLKDKNARYKIYAKMDSLVMSKAPIVPLYYDEVVRFTRKNIHGLGINPINLLNLKRVYKK